MLVENWDEPLGSLTSDGNSDKRLSSLDSFLNHESHVIGTIGSKVHGPTSTVDENTNRKCLIGADARRTNNVQSETVLAESGSTLIGGVLNEVSTLFHNFNRVTYTITDTRVTILLNLKLVESLIVALRVLETKLSNGRLSERDTEE